MSKLSMLRKAAGLTTKEEETKEDQPVIEIEENPVEEIPVVNSEETPVNGTPVVETQGETTLESKEPSEETSQDQGTPDENESKEEDEDDPKPKRRSRRSSARDSKDSQDGSEDDAKKEEDQEAAEPKRGRKKGVRRDRVIVMLDKETIEILDSFSISRSGTARAVILACQDFLVNLEEEVAEDELVSKIKEKLA